MSDTSTIERSPAPTATDEPYVSLTVLSDMRLLMSPTQIAREGEHNSALFKIVAQPSSLDAYACRAEVRTSDGSTTYRLVVDGEFRLTIDMSVTGIGHLQLVYSDGVDVTRKTALAQFTVARSINAIDQSDPDFQDGLAYLQSRAFANVTYAADSGVLAFYNVGMNPLDSVVIAGGTGGVPEVPAASGAYARTRTPNGADWTDFNTLRVASLDSPQFAGTPTAPTAGVGSNSSQLATTEWTQNQFNFRDYLPRTGGQMSGPLITIPGTNAANLGIAIGDNSTGFYRPGAGVLIASVSGVNVTQFMPAICAFFVPIHVGNNVVQSVGDPAQDTDALNLRTGDSRYLQQATADNRYLALVGGSLSGDLYMTAASGLDGQIGINLGGRGASIYWGNATVLRRGGAGESVYIENNNGSNRSEVITQLLGDARYLQPTVGGIVTGPLQVTTPPVIPNDAANKAYVDTAIAAVVAPTALRTLAYMPNEITIVSTATTFLDVNFPLPALGLRNILITVTPIFASTEPQGTSTWQLIYATPLVLLESPVLAYKLGADPTSFIRAPAQFLAAVDSTPGTIRVLLSVRLSGAGGPLTQVGAGGTIAANMRTIVTVQDLGPTT